MAEVGRDGVGGRGALEGRVGSALTWEEERSGSRDLLAEERESDRAGPGDEIDGEEEEGRRDGEGEEERRGGGVSELSATFGNGGKATCSSCLRPIAGLTPQ